MTPRSLKLAVFGSFVSFAGVGSGVVEILEEAGLFIVTGMGFVTVGGSQLAICLLSVCAVEYFAFLEDIPGAPCELP